MKQRRHTFSDYIESIDTKLLWFLALVGFIALKVVDEPTSSLEHDAACTMQLVFSCCKLYRQGVYRYLASDIEQLSNGGTLSRPFIKILFAPSINYGGGSQTEVTKGDVGREEASIDRVASVLLERDETATSVTDANQRLSESEKGIHFGQVDKMRWF